MKAYIHYKQRADTYLLISNSPTEPEYKLGIEVECDQFYRALDYMTLVAAGNAIHVSKRINVIDNMSLSTFKHSFISCMDTVRRFSRENYTLRFVNEDGTVSLYARTIFRKL